VKIHDIWKIARVGKAMLCKVTWPGKVVFLHTIDSAKEKSSHIEGGAIVTPQDCLMLFYDATLGTRTRILSLGFCWLE